MDANGNRYRDIVYSLGGINMQIGSGSGNDEEKKGVGKRDKTGGGK